MGTVRTITVPDPAVNTNWSLTVPANKTYRLMSFAFKLVTSAAAGNRRFGWVVDDGTDTGVYVGSISNTNQTASSSVYVTSYPGSEAVSWTGGMLNLGMPIGPSGLFIPSGHRLRSYSGQDFVGGDSMLAGDQMSNIRVRVEEFGFEYQGE